MKRYLSYIFLGLLIVSQLSCEDNSIDTEREEIRAYLEAQGKLAQAIETPEGVFIWMAEEGLTNSGSPDISSTVNVKYEGWLLDGGDIFDSSFGSTQQLILANTILGWRVALPYFNKEGKGEIYIPSAYGYGDLDTPSSSGASIPGGSILVFDIELVGFF